MTERLELNTPWTLHFDRDGTEDIAIICDSNGHDLATSRHFWLPEGDDPVPPTLAGMRVMAAAPKLLHALQQVLAWAEPESGNFTQAELEWLDQARTAIAEATTGQEA